MDTIYSLLALPAAIAVGGIFLAFVSACQAAREEEFEARQQKEALARGLRSPNDA